MNKIKIILILILLLTGCLDGKTLVTQKKMYQRMIVKLEEAKEEEFKEPLGYEINIYIEKVVATELMYRIVIDNPTKSMKDMVVLVIHNYPTNDIFPSIGIFDEQVSLVPGVIDFKNNYVKGINLIGYIDYDKDIITFDGIFKVLISYQDEFGNSYNDYYWSYN